MVRRVFRLGLVVVIAVAVVGVMVPQPAAAKKAAPLFTNYYVAPGPCGGPGAELYISPRPTPPLVGHTWVTYQPLMPHEFLYTHHRCYVHRHDDARPTRTSVSWRHAYLPNMVPRYVDGKLFTHLFNDF